MHANRELFFIISLSVILGPLSVNWFFQAVEDFKYITLRSLFMKIISFILLLICVKEKDDLITYAVICLIAAAGNNFFNIIHIRKFIQIKGLKICQLSVFKHLKPSLMLFVLNIVISIYTNLDTVMLGFMKDDEAVGYYSVSVRISHIVLSLVTSLGTVLLPRFSYLFETGNIEEFNRLCRKSMDFTIGISLPVVTGLVLLSPSLISFMFGLEYQPSILILQLISPIILFAGITNVLGIQILYPKGKEILVVSSTLGAAIVNISLNIILIPRFSYYGAAASTCIAELIVLLIQLWLGKKHLPSKLFTKNIFAYIFGSAIMGIAVLAVQHLCKPFILQLILGFIIGVTVYYVMLIAVHNELAMSIKNSVLRKEY